MRRIDGGPGSGEFNTTRSGWRLGLFGDLGAGYLINPHVSLGVIAAIEAAYWRERNSGSSLGSGKSVLISTQILSAVLTVYF